MHGRGYFWPFLLRCQQPLFVSTLSDGFFVFHALVSSLRAGGAARHAGGADGVKGRDEASKRCDPVTSTAAGPGRSAVLGEGSSRRSENPKNNKIK